MQHKQTTQCWLSFTYWLIHSFRRFSSMRHCRMVLCMPLCRCQSNVQWALVIFNRSKPGLSGLANPLCPVSRRAQNASLESPVMILLGVSAAVMTKSPKRKDKSYSHDILTLTQVGDVTKAVHTTHRWLDQLSRENSAGSWRWAISWGHDTGVIM